MEIILNSCNTKPPYTDLNLQHIDPCSDTLAPTPRKIMKKKFILEVLYGVRMAHKLFHEPKKILLCTRCVQNQMRRTK
jgi:hypothetical protein